MDEQYIQAIRDIEKDEHLRFPRNVVLDMANKKWEFNHNDWGCASHFHSAT